MCTVWIQKFKIFDIKNLKNVINFLAWKIIFTGPDWKLNIILTIFTKVNIVQIGKEHCGKNITYFYYIEIQKPNKFKNKGVAHILVFCIWFHTVPKGKYLQSYIKYVHQ